MSIFILVFLVNILLQDIQGYVIYFDYVLVNFFKH